MRAADMSDSTAQDGAKPFANEDNPQDPISGFRTSMAFEGRAGTVWKNSQAGIRADETREFRALLATRQLETATRRGLKSVERVTHERRLQHGRLDRRAVTRTAMGAPDVMSRRGITPGMTTAVQVMLDASWSMGDPEDAPGMTYGRVSRISAALAVLSVVVPAIHRAGARVALAAFTTSCASGDGQAVAQGATKGVGLLADSASKPSVFPLFRFGDRPTSARCLEAFRKANRLGGTPMAREANWATAQLLGQRAERRIALWLCDGEAFDAAAAATAMRLALAQGVEHCGVGIGSGIDLDTMQEVFGRSRASVVGERLADLPGAIEAALLGEVAR